MSKLNFRVGRLKAGREQLPFRWWLDSPKNDSVINEGEIQMELRGWVLSKEPVIVLIKHFTDVVSYELNTLRHDVIRKFQSTDNEIDCSAICGFSYRIPMSGSVTELGVRIGESEYWLSKIEVVADKPVLNGKNGWLFLDNDTNASVAQFRGERPISSRAMNEWKAYVEEVKALAERDNIAWCLFVAPAKEEVFPDFYPFVRSDKTPIDQFLVDVELGKKTIFPKLAIAAVRELSYYKVDTHWSDYGACVGAAEILKTLLLEEYISYLSVPYRVVSTHGDLGGKVIPRQTSFKLIADFSGSNVEKCYDNGILNTGKIWIYKNSMAPIKEAIVIFGDSFSINMARLLGLVFSRVVYAHTVAVWDTAIVDEEKAKYVVLQTNQRFLVTAPNFSLGVWNLLRSKIKKMDQVEVHARLEKIDQGNTTANSYYFKKMTSLFQESLEL